MWKPRSLAARSLLGAMAAAATLAATAAIAAAGAQQPKHPMTWTDILSLRSLGSVAVAPDGQRIAYTVSAWTHPNAKPASGDTALGDKHEMRSHIWLVPTSGGAPRQLTFGERGETQPAWSPDGRQLAFLAARGGGGGAADEQPRNQVWILPLDGGEAWELTSAHDGVTGLSWSPDGTRIAYLTTDTLPRGDEARTKRKDDPQVFEGDFHLSHLWVVDVATKHAREVAHGAFTIRGAPSWSPDGQRIAFSTAPTPMIRDDRSDAYVATLAGGPLERISTTPDVSTAPVWSPDGATIAFTVLPNAHHAHADSIADRALGNEHIVLYDVAARRARDVYDPAADVSAAQLQWTPDGKRLLFVTGDRAFQSVYAYDVAAHRLDKIFDRQLVRGLSLSRDGRVVAFSMETPDAPYDLYASDLAFKEPRKLTDINPQVASFALGHTEVVQWKSSDGTPVEGVLLEPVGYQPGRKYPLLVEAHGGPTGATSAGFKASWGSPGQYWAARGWAILYPNPRGSTGYGEKFMRANIMDWGGGDYRDIMSGVDAMIRRGIADSTRMAFEGWSYGGYMTAWVVSQTSRFKAARMGAGLSDLQSMYGTTDIPGYIGTFFSGMPTAKTLDFYRARSAITYVDRVTTPLLILQGGSDQRVPIGQSMEFYRALRDRGKTVELVFYPREGHGLSEWYHQLDKMQREYAWIVKYTLGQQVSQTADR
ncbi:MAG TPA: S9 family peptidase [Gemmatimonadaceae bacterium]|nr:S9 family peptidase [Gemmatimonadaceae bacterium]